MEKTFEFRISAEKSVSIWAKTFLFFIFIFWRPPAFGRKKPSNFRVFREILPQFSDKPCETDSRTIQGRLHFFHSFKIAPPPLFQILATRLLASVECGKFKLKQEFQSGKILAYNKKSEICATSTLKLIKMMLKCRVTRASSTCACFIRI